MNAIKIIAHHKAFDTYFFEAFEFTYADVKCELRTEEKKLIMTFTGQSSISLIYNVFFEVHDLLFLILGGFPKIEYVFENDIKGDISKLVRKYDTASNYNEPEARLCEISLITINENILNKMSMIHHQTLSSIQYITCAYYSHMVTNHRIELVTHTIDGFFRHTVFYDQLFQQIKKQKPHKRKLDYIEMVERVFKSFFVYHEKYDCQILKCIDVKNELEFYKIIADTRNDFSHFLESKEYRLIKGRDMAYFIDLIFYAERLFILEEVLEIEISELQVMEYMYILHDWIDEIVNKRDDRIKSKRYMRVANAKKWNELRKTLNLDLDNKEK